MKEIISMSTFPAGYGHLKVTATFIDGTTESITSTASEAGDLNDEDQPERAQAAWDYFVKIFSELPCFHEKN